ncbi:peptide chain release factor 1 [Micromonospora rosaria]|uniref:Peptide chain release factor 1 n=1 Tax=Micromonospora rosaria TaxID=47874 RepID=A0A136PXA1_9ACTN|nr:peptide chain release factor-like protein [Micromonospora rosaria]KXK62816.1 peptide chain release factor 1 [Micromonospora rosaria]
MTVHLLISAGRGPQECAWAVARLLRRLTADAAGHRVTVDRVRAVPGDRSGTYRSVLLRIDGADAEAFAAGWTGTLCWQAPSPYRVTARRNWYVTARPCPVAAPASPFSVADVEIVGCRTGGPGGQHRDKASTAARTTHRPSGTVVVVDTERHFGLNRRIALDLLRRRVEERDEAARRAVDTPGRHLHDDLVRGNPTRVERPSGADRDRAGRPRRPPLPHRVRR